MPMSLAKDIVEVVKSPAYRAVIDDPKNIYSAFPETGMDDRDTPIAAVAIPKFLR